MMLDTHYATREMLNNTYTVNEQEYHFYKYKEKGRTDVFSGMNDYAKWLLLDDIKKILSEEGFSDIEIIKDNVQRNGPRVTMFASRE